MKPTLALVILTAAISISLGTSCGGNGNRADSGAGDAGTDDAGAHDAGASDAGSSDAGNLHDGGSDAGNVGDAGSDAGADAGSDAGSDAGDDAGSDAGSDAGTSSDGGIDGGSCTASASYGTVSPGNTQYGEYDPGADAGDDYYQYQARLNNDAAPDIVQMEIYPGYGAFTDAGVAPGTYTLTGDDLNYGSCGLCLLVVTNLDSQGMSGDAYMATGGSITITALHPVLSGSMSNLTFEHVSLDPQAPHISTPLHDGCNSRIDSLVFSVSDPMGNGP